MSKTLMRMMEDWRNMEQLPLSKRERYAGARLRLEAEIDAERARIGLDEAAFDRAYAGAVKEANLQPHEIARVDWAKAAEIMNRMEDAYVTGNSTLFQQVAAEWRSFLLAQRESLLEVASL